MVCSHHATYVHVWRRHVALESTVNGEGKSWLVRCCSDTRVGTTFLTLLPRFFSHAAHAAFVEDVLAAASSAASRAASFWRHAVLCAFQSSAWCSRQQYNSK